MVRIEFLELFSCWGMVWNWPEAPGESISTSMNDHVKNCSHIQIFASTQLPQKIFTWIRHLARIVDLYDIEIRKLVKSKTNCIKWQHFQFFSQNFRICLFLVCLSLARHRPLYYSYSIAILKIYALRVTPESLPASRSIRFAASAAKFSISRCLSCPEKQFYQINRVFHIFWIWVNFRSF